MVLHLSLRIDGFGVTFNDDVTKDSVFYTSTSRFVDWFGVFGNVTESCGSPRMIFRTRPHGHRPRFFSSMTSTPRSLPNFIVRRTVRRLNQTPM
jgi:hypothetical protein